VRRLKALGHPGVVGYIYIDDFYLTAETFAECEAGYHAMI
jgi:hypothetical protein